MAIAEASNPSTIAPATDTRSHDRDEQEQKEDEHVVDALDHDCCSSLCPRRTYARQGQNSRRYPRGRENAVEEVTDQQSAALLRVAGLVSRANKKRQRSALM